MCRRTEEKVAKEIEIKTIFPDWLLFIPAVGSLTCIVISWQNELHMLWNIYSRVGVPREMLTDKGSQFTSTLLAEIIRLVSIKQLTITPYHPMCDVETIHNGKIEMNTHMMKYNL